MNQQYFEIARRIKMIHCTFAGNRKRSMDAYDLTFAQMDIMVYLMKNSDHRICQKKLEEATRLTNPTVTGILNRLEEKGLIIRRVDEKDRRYRYVEISEKGRNVLEEMGDSLHQTELRLFGCLSEEEAAQLLKLLDKVAEHATYDKDTRRDLC